MRKLEKELLKLERKDLSAACKLAKKAGYYVEVFDGDGETGMIKPQVSFSRKFFS